LKLFAKKGYFFNFEGYKTNFTTFGSSLEKTLGNPLLAPPGKNPSDAHGSRPTQVSTKVLSQNVKGSTVCFRFSGKIVKEISKEILF